MKPHTWEGAAGAAGAAGAGGEGAPFRVRVSMERYFGDERARAYVCVRGARRVRWLAARLRAQFALPPRFALLSRGHLLPPAEPLAVLRPDDVVDVVPSRIDLGVYGAEVDALPSVHTVVSLPASGVDDSDAAESRDLTDRRSPTAEPISEVVTPSPTEPDHEFDGENDLSEHKRRALYMLDRYCGNEQFGQETQLARPPRRRRVRRRRREQSAVSPAPAAAHAPGPASAPAAAHAPGPGPAPAPAAAHAPGPGPAPAPAAAHAHALAPAPADGISGVVLRNGTHGSRAPRLIHPLTDHVSSS